MKKGFTLIELVMVLSIISIMATIALPSYLSMRQEGMLTKAQKELTLLQSAVENYWQEKACLPDNINLDIFNVENKILTQTALDPWKTDGSNYGYQKGITPEGEEYYIIFSKGLGEKVDYLVSGNMILNQNGNIIVSNLPVLN